MVQTKILLVEDHPLFSKGLRHLIESNSHFVVIGEATNSAEALELLREKKPDLAIIDLNLGDEDGLMLIKSMKAENAGLHMLVLSMHEERYYAERVLRAGAHGYIMKAEAGDKVVDAIKTVMAGKTWLSESERTRIFENAIGEKSLKDGTDWLASVSKLSDRQLQIFSFIGKGLGTVEIAAKLNLSTKTIDTHKEHIKVKLHCNSSQELRQLAIEWMSRLPRS